MRSWLKKALFAAAVFVLCWGGAVWYWHDTNTLPDTGALVLYLLLLPLVLLFLIWFARKLILLASAAPAAAVVAPAAAAEAAPPPAAATTPVLHLAGAALRLPHGASAAAVRDAFADSAARPALDDELKDDYGFPVMTARVLGLDTDATEAAFDAWRSGQGLPDPHFNDEQWRALTLGAEIAAELGQAATAHQHLAGYLDATPAARAALALPTLQLLPLLPSGWDLGQRLAGGRWLMHLVEQQGWPANRLALSAAAERGSVDPLVLIGQLAQHSARESLPYVVMLVSCASNVGETTIDAWASQGILFTARNQRGQIPGEGAAGLLLADPAQAALLDAGTTPQLHGAVHGARAASADVGQTDAKTLTALATEALANAASSAGEVQLITSDTDHRGSRMGELMATANAASPHLDAATQVLGIAGASGQTGPVGAVAALVLAQQETLANASHVLYVSNQDPYQRSAAVIRPQPDIA